MRDSLQTKVWPREESNLRARIRSPSLYPLSYGARLTREGGGWDSNPRPPGPQPGALPTELPPPWTAQDSGVSSGVPSTSKSRRGGVRSRYRLQGSAVTPREPCREPGALRRSGPPPLQDKPGSPPSRSRWEPESQEGPPSGALAPAPRTGTSARTFARRRGSPTPSQLSPCTTE